MTPAFRRILGSLAVTSVILTTWACTVTTTDNGAGSGTPGAGATCKTARDCASGTICISDGTSATCAPTCSASATSCSASATCQGVGSFAVNVCQPPPPAAATPAPPKKSVPCKADAECSAVYTGAVCASFMGVKDCTIKCEASSTCNPPSVGGVATTFLGCLKDEGDATRTVCLPRIECATSPLSCVSGFPGADSGADAFGGFDAGF